MGEKRKKQWKQVKETGEVKKCVVIVILVDINLSSRRFFLFSQITHPDRHENAKVKAERKLQNVYDNLTNPSIICSWGGEEENIDGKLALKGILNAEISLNLFA